MCLIYILNYFMYYFYVLYYIKYKIFMMPWKGTLFNSFRNILLISIICTYLFI